MQKGVHELKETQKGIELMCHEMEKIYSAGMDVKQIVRLVKVTEKEVQKWIDESLCVMK